MAERNKAQRVLTFGLVTLDLCLRGLIILPWWLISHVRDFDESNRALIACVAVGLLATLSIGGGVTVLMLASPLVGGLLVGLLVVSVLAITLPVGICSRFVWRRVRATQIARTSVRGVGWPYFLYLRAFDTDIAPHAFQRGPSWEGAPKVVETGRTRPSYWSITVRRDFESLDKTVAQIFRPWGDIVALNPGHVSDSEKEWLSRVERLASSAAYIVCAPFLNAALSGAEAISDEDRSWRLLSKGEMYEGFIKELRLLEERQLIERTLFVFPWWLGKTRYAALCSALQQVVKDLVLPGEALTHPDSGTGLIVVHCLSNLRSTTSVVACHESRFGHVAELEHLLGPPQAATSVGPLLLVFQPPRGKNIVHTPATSRLLIHCVKRTAILG